MQVNVRRGCIYLVNIDNILKRKENIQAGYRPCVVITNDIGCKNSNVVSVVPLTSRIEKRLIPTHCYIDTNWSVNIEKNSIVLCEQVFTVNKSDLGVWSGVISKEGMREIDKCLAMAFGLTLA